MCLRGVRFKSILQCIGRQNHTCVASPYRACDSDMCHDRPFVPWEGCAACWSNDDHRNILLCDGCDLEFHHYCVVPPLPDIPSGDRSFSHSM